MKLKFDELSSDRQMVLVSKERVDLKKMFHNRTPSEIFESLNGLKTEDDVQIIFMVCEENHYSSYSPTDDHYWEEDILYLETYRPENDSEYNVRMLTLEIKHEREEKVKVRAQLVKEKEASQVEAQERKFYEKLKKKFEKA